LTYSIKDERAFAKRIAFAIALEADIANFIVVL
jgi:hypothetical protein